MYATRCGVDVCTFKLKPLAEPLSTQLKPLTTDKRMRFFFLFWGKPKCLSLRVTFRQHSQKMDETPDLTSLRRALQGRASEKQSAELLFAREKAMLDDAQQETQLSLSQANEALSVRRRRLESQEHELVKLSVSRSMQLRYKEECIGKAEIDRRNLKSSLTDSTSENERLQALLVTARQDLSEVQQRADKHLHNIRLLDRELTEAKRKAAGIDSQNECDVAHHNEERDELERVMHDLEATCSVLQGKLHAAAVGAASTEVAHSATLQQRKKLLAELRDSFEDTRSRLTSVRETLATLDRDEEETTRRRRRWEDESTQDFLSGKAADRMKAISAAEDRLHQVHVEYDRQANQLHASIEEATRDMVPIRQDIHTLFQEELKLSEILRELQNTLMGDDEVRARLALLSTQIDSTKLSLQTATQSRDVAAQRCHDVVEECAMIKDIVAPLADVEAAVASARERFHSDRQRLAEVEARATIERVAMEGRVQGVYAENASIQAAIDEVRERHTHVVEDAQERTRSLESDLRVLGLECESLDAKILELRQRNQLLESSVSHNLRQKKLLEEDLANRRELARRAAATLLSQLEQS
jgi:chromosome segregation ATPase